MKTISLKALGATLLAVGLVVAGVAAPAQAATMNGTAVASGGGIAATGTNAYSIQVTFTPVTSGADEAKIVFPTGWTRVNASGSAFCSSLTIASSQTPLNCSSFSTSSMSLSKGGTALALGPISVEFPPGSLNVSSSRDFSLSTLLLGTTPKDSGIATLASAPTVYTVTFDANGGTGTTAAQNASSATALTSNAFTTSGFTFSGWNTAANGSGTAYANGASYAFSSSTTLFAQWTANSSGGSGSGSSGGSASPSSETLANTGINASANTSLLTGGLAIAGIGLAMLMIARRKRSN